jgi:hypothetical protein
MVFIAAIPELSSHKVGHDGPDSGAIKLMRWASLGSFSITSQPDNRGKCQKWSFRPHSLTLSRHDGAGPGAGCARLRPSRATARLHRADRPDLSELDAAPATELLGQRRVVSGRAVAGSAFRKAPCGPARPWCEAS